jgi:hypothetical protein
VRSGNIFMTVLKNEDNKQRHTAFLPSNKRCQRRNKDVAINAKRDRQEEEGARTETSTFFPTLPHIIATEFTYEPKCLEKV